MHARHDKLLTELLAQPTAPFREEHVVTIAQRVLKQAGIPFFRDPVGNVVVGCASRADYRCLVRQKNAEPLRIFIAHMDHPGFHGVRWVSDTRLRIKWHGGSPVRHLSGSRVWLATAQDYRAEGRLGRVRLLKSRHALHTAEVQVISTTKDTRPKADTLYGGFKFRAPVWRAGKKIYTKAADDLVGVFAIIATALALHKKSRGIKSPPFLGLLTRAEEVGFVGAIGHFELDWLAGARRPVIAVSLETSRTLPGALIGKGAVVRLGDRRTVFHPGYLKVLTDVAQDTLPGKHQRRVMDGGSCEATAAITYGLPAIGLSVPLGNYHNEGFEGGPGCRAPGGPAPEFVHLDDIEGLLKLCRALMRNDLPWDRPWETQRRLMRRKLREYRRLL
jgi:endoglucanase